MSETYNNSQIYVDLIPSAEVNVDLIPSAEVNVDLIPSAEVNVDLISSAEVNVEITSSLEIQVEIVATGPQGPPGDAHDLSADNIIETTEKQFISLADKLKLSGFIHDQIASSAEWIVDHPLDKFASVSVVDTGGNLVIGDVEYISNSRIIIRFAYEFSGKAYLN